MLTAREIRWRFLEYFRVHGHEIVASSALIPRDDPSLLFTNAGMVQFKKVFLGQEQREYQRAVTSQKCLRVSGKHNDLENVGRTARHHTFFEMLGNFSFGDYFKEEAIRLAWNFVTEELKLPRDKLYVTVFREDDEAADLWQSVAGLKPERIFRMGEKDNFWAMGDTGPCGPCSEIYYDQGPAMVCGPDCGIGQCDCDRYLEIWNLVFMQYDQVTPTERINLPRPSIDTGMGLERIAAVCQGKQSNYDSDLFQEFIQFTASLAGQSYKAGNEDVDTALRVIADHSRAAAILIFDGVLPSNEGRGYVLRRLIRRACRFGRLIGMQEPFLHKVALKVSEVMGEDFPQGAVSTKFMDQAVRAEEERFSLTLDKGLSLLEDELAKLAASKSATVPGIMCFTLYDTYGFPLDIVNDIAEKRGFLVDEQGFAAHMREQKERSRAAQKSGLFGVEGKDPLRIFQPLLDANIVCDFTGHGCLSDDGRVLALLHAQGESADALEEGAAGFVVTNVTPFYGASGGQAGDTGMLRSFTGQAKVTDTLWPAPELVVHQIVVTSGEMLPEQTVYLEVDKEKRLASARNHSCTHLLHAALRRVLGEHVQQAGSLVAPDRLRFDFSHIKAMTPEELAVVEQEVNRAILADLPVEAAVMRREEAEAAGAIALFGEKYGEQVRVVRIGDGESTELCGGTHLSATGEAGFFAILAESGIAAGTRRIEAATGWNAFGLFQNQRQELETIAGQLKSRPGELAPKVAALQKETRSLRKELEQAGQASAGQGDIMAGLTSVEGIPLLAVRVENLPIKALRELMDKARSRMPSGVACLASAEDGKASLILYVSKDLHAKFTAPDLIRQLAPSVGAAGGGGRPDLAQTGGSDPAGIEKAFEKLRDLLK
ncbi:MAG: alanine--tRNA ligase [Deltaproteobacteria bacterium]|jgi:alanyl-tRNA synthetase|nr:alanine--tRNA ligase [Deltaproteobacteria bacterium]